MTLQQKIWTKSREKEGHLNTTGSLKIITNEPLNNTAVTMSKYKENNNKSCKKNGNSQENTS